MISIPVDGDFVRHDVVRPDLDVMQRGRLDLYCSQSFTEDSPDAALTQSG